MGDKNCQVTCIHTLVLIQPGGVRLIKDVRDGRGVKGKAEKCGKGGGGGPKSRKFCGRPLCMVPKEIFYTEITITSSYGK